MFHVNTQYFSEEGIKFRKLGYYTREVPGSLLWKQYWTEQLERCINGYSVGGTRITGDHYYYLNFCQIRLTEDNRTITKNRTVRKITAFPAFWDGDYNFFHARDIARNGIGVSELAKLGLDYVIHPDHLTGGKHLIVGKARRKGYSQPHSEIVMTPEGEKTMGEIRVGDYVIGSDGKPVKVLELHPQGKLPVWEVELRDGRKVRCSGDHLWSVTDFRGNQRTCSTEKLATVKLIKNQGQSNQYYHWHIKNCEAVEYDEKPLPIDPYSLGVYIGNGCYNKKGSGIQITSIDQDCIDRLDFGKYSNYGIQYTYYDKALKQELKTLGLDCYSHEKFIPEMYLYGSVNQRMELLRGLMDTDGTSDKSGFIRYGSSSKRLIDDICKLLASLGIRYYVGDGIDPDRYPTSFSKRFHWMITITTDKPVFHLSRKLKNLRFDRKYGFNKIPIVNIKSLGYEEEQSCITVDSADHLYLTRDYVVTHNSYKNAAIVTNTFNTQRRSLCLIGAFEKKYLYPKGTMQMVTDYMNFLNEFTAFTKRRGVVDKQDHRRASLIDLLPNGQKIERGYMSEVIAVTFKDNPDAAHPYSQQIYTPNGIISWGEVKIGTELFTESGGTTLVEEVLEKGEKEIYEFTFNDGRTVRSTEDHKWNVVRRCYSGKKTRGTANGLEQKEFTEKTVTTSEIFNMVNVNTTLCNKPKIKLPSPIPLPERETVVDAYTLGLLLGDGCFTRTTKDKAYITMMWSDLDDLKKFIPYTIINCKWDQVNRKQNQIVIPGCKEEFRKLGLLDKYSHNKFIPENYKFNSEKVRWDVLNGLLDSDGSVTKDYGVIEYSSNSEQLANDVIWICHSLGLGSSKKSRVIKGKVYYRVYIYCKPDETRLFNLERKKQKIKFKKFTGYGLNKSSYIQIEKVEVVGVENSKCVNVSNPSNLYLVGDFIPTHNCRGKDADLVLFEEAGKFDNLKPAFLATKPTVESGDMTTGQMIIFGCVCADTKVWTHEGRLINIQDLKQEEGIIGYGGIGATKEPIIWMKPPAEKPCYRITTEKGGVIECSDDHPLLVSKNHKVLEVSGQPNRKKVTFVRADQIKPGDQLMSVRQVPIFGTKTIWKPRVVGFLIGNGYYGKNASVSVSMEGEEIFDWINKEFGGNITVNKSWTTKRGNQFREVTLRRTISELNNIGIYGQTWDNKQLPDNIYECNQWSISELIGGYIDADGSVGYNPKKKALRVTLTSKYLHLLEGIKTLLYKLNIGCNIVRENRKSGFKPGEVYRLYISCQKDIIEFKKHVKLLSTRKQKVIDDYVSHCTGRYMYDDCFFEINPDNNKGTFYLQGDNNHLNNLTSNFVKTVEFIGNKPVYNLNAGITHTYVTNGFISGNTGGDMESGTIDFENMFYNPDPYNILPFENIWDDGGRGTFCGFFHPCHLNKDGFTDKDGNSLVAKARESEEAIREKLKRTSKDPGTFDRHITEYPFKPAEAFLQTGGNIFPLGAIVDHKNYLTRSSITQYIGVNGMTYRDSKNRVKFRPSSEVRPVMTFPHDMKSDNSGCIVMYQSPYMESGKVPDNLYVICHDPYGQNLDGPSLGVAYVLKRPNNLSSPDDMIVASYVGRPSSQDEYNKNLFELAELYNARIGFENDRGDVISFAKRFRKLDWLEEEFELGYNSSLPKSQVRRLYGMHMTDARKRQGEIYLRDWLLQERSTDIDGNKLLNLHTIYDVALLDELRTYNPKKGNFDRVSAMLIGMYYFKEIEFKQLHVMVEQAFSDDSFFNRSLF